MEDKRVGEEVEENVVALYAQCTLSDMLLRMSSLCHHVNEPCSDLLRYVNLKLKTSTIATGSAHTLSCLAGLG